jgi:hypothetical protein
VAAYHEVSLLKSTNRQGQEKLLITDGKQYLTNYIPIDISMGIQ